MSAADELERMAEEMDGRAVGRKPDRSDLILHPGAAVQSLAACGAYAESAKRLRARAAELRAAPVEPVLPLDTTDSGSVWVRFGKPFVIAKTSYFQGVAWAHFDGLRDGFEFGELTAENGWRYVGRVEPK